MTDTNEDFLVSVARLIAERDMTIADFYEAIGCDLDNHRVDAGHQISEIAGIFKGWDTTSEKGAGK